MFNEKNSMQGFSIKAFHLLIAFVLQKPSKESKAKDHLKYLEKRLARWRDGDIDLLYKECCAIQGELSQTFRKSDNKMKSFCNLVLQGRLSAAVKVLSQTDATGVLPPTKHVRAKMALLQPIGQDVNREELLQGIPPEVHPVIFENLGAKRIYSAALRTHGSSGPSSLDANNLKKLFCSKKHNRASELLCESLAALGRRICTKFVDPKSLESYIACRAIALNKNDGKGGIRPIGIGEIIRRVLGKAIAQIFGANICHAAGSQQTCAGQEGGVDEAIHAAREIFQMESTEAVLLIDAESAFNRLNRQTALLNIGHICPKSALILSILIGCQPDSF